MLDLRNVKVGDIIEDNSKESVGKTLKLMHMLAKDGIETDFVYRNMGEEGLWLKVTDIKK